MRLWVRPGEQIQLSHGISMTSTRSLSMVQLVTNGGAGAGCGGGGGWQAAATAGHTMLVLEAQSIHTM